MDGSLNNERLFLMVLEVGNSKNKGPVDVLRPTFWFTDSYLFTTSSQYGRGERALWGLFDKGTDTIHQGPTLIT